MITKNILIMGAGVAGKLLLKEIKTHPELGIKPLGFIDDDPRKVGQKINGLSVLGNRKKLKFFIKKLKIDKVFIALPSIDGKIIGSVLKECVKVGIPCQTVPRVKEIIEGKVDIRRVREVGIEDLLGRPVKKAEIATVARFIKGKVILVTGAAGSIGSELCRQLASYQPTKIITLDYWENGLYELGLEFKEFFPGVPHILAVANIQDKTRIESILQIYKPSLIFHAAAYKHVPLMEENPSEAVKNNIFGTKILVEAAKKLGVKKFIFISTDKAVNPQSIMGATKLIGELIVNSANYSSVRFGNVLDSSGSVLPIFKKQIEKGRSLTITDKEMTRYFMTIPEAIQLILKAAILTQGGETFVLDMGSPIKIIDLAKKFILLSGLIPGKDVKIKYIGRRPGEKLKEELIGRDEEILKTKFAGIFFVKRKLTKQNELETCLKNLKKYCQIDNEKLVKKELKQFISQI